jgi:Tfp pilus assembly protein PilO
MYFIPRNNAFYNYIAHTSVKRRYSATLFVLVAIGLIGFYGIYMPLAAHIMMYRTELANLKKQQQESDLLKKNNKELLERIDTNKKNISEHIIADDAKENYCSQRMQFVFDTITKAGLTLISYGSCKGKDKIWYAKDSAHLQAAGSMEQILSFLKTIKESEQMIALSHLGITRVKENIFQLSCDVGIILVKKQ